MTVRNTYDYENGPHSVHGFRTGRFDFGINTTFIIYRIGTTLIDRGGWIQYVMTTNGPQPLAVYESSGALQIDYQHYLEKQLAPVCDGLLALYDTSFAEICGSQMSLF